jgi:hypothetical protein
VPRSIAFCSSRRMPPSQIERRDGTPAAASAPIATRLYADARRGSRGSSLPFAVRLGLTGLLAALAFAGCTTSGSSSGNTSASSSTAASLQPPAAPTKLVETIVPAPDAAGGYGADFSWAPPSGPISGYYFWTVLVYADPVTPPPLICGPKWETIPASATTHEMPNISSVPESYICAFNDAGTSPMVKFAQPPEFPIPSAT